MEDAHLDRPGAGRLSRESDEQNDTAIDCRRPSHKVDHCNCYSRFVSRSAGPAQLTFRVRLLIINRQSLGRDYRHGDERCALGRLLSIQDSPIGSSIQILALLGPTSAAEDSKARSRITLGVRCVSHLGDASRERSHQFYLSPTRQIR